MRSQRPFSRLRELQRVVGVGRALHIAFVWAIAQRYLVIVRDLTELADLPSASSTFSCHGFDSTSASELAALDRRLSVAEVERRIDEGQICQVFRQAGRIVHFRWVATRQTHLQYLGLDLDLADGDCFLYEVFTVVETRARGIHSQVAAQTTRIAAAAGYRRMAAMCAWWNAPALRVGEKFGYEIVGTVTRWQLGPVSRFSVSGDLELAQRTLSLAAVPDASFESNRDQVSE